jgi:hypothetical protein
MDSSRKTLEVSCDKQRCRVTYASDPMRLELQRFTVAESTKSSPLLVAFVSP